MVDYFNNNITRLGQAQDFLESFNWTDDARREAATATRLNRERARERDQDVEREYVPSQAEGGP